jgi:hypothetical protein
LGVLVSPALTLGPKPSTLAKMRRLVQLQSFINGRLHSTFTFLINPESYQQTEPVRALVLQTLGGAYVDLVGPGLVQIQFSGTTGLRATYVNGIYTDGYERFQQLLEFIRYMWSQPVLDRSRDYRFYFYNWTDDQYYEVLPLSNTWSQAVPRQTVFYYNITLVGLRQLNQPSSAPPYDIRQFFTSQPAASVVSLAQDAALHGGLALELIQMGSQVGLPAYVVGLIQQNQADYTPYLSPSDFPTDAAYPGIGPIASSMSSLLQQTAFPYLQTLVQGGPTPFASSMSALTLMVQQAQSLLGQMEKLQNVPTLLEGEWGAFVDDLQALTLFPEVFLP